MEGRGRGYFKSGRARQMKKFKNHWSGMKERTQITGVWVV